MKDRDAVATLKGYFYQFDFADQYMIGAGGGSMVDVLFKILLGFGVSLGADLHRTQGCRRSDD